MEVKPSMSQVSLENLTLEEEVITLRGKTLKILRPAKLEEVFQGDPFLETEKFPFWFKLWEASLVLADYLATLSPPKKILELDAGLGVVSLFASAFDHEVTATDFDDLPLALIQRSAEINHLKGLKVQKLDFFNPHLSETFDVIAGSEIIFKKSFYEPLLKIFTQFLKKDGEILLAHAEDRKKVLIPFLIRAQEFFEVQTSFRTLRSEDEKNVIILNRLLPKKSET